MGAHGDARLDLHLDAILRHAIDGGAAALGIGAVNDLGVDRSAHGLDHGLAGALRREVDGAGAVPIEHDAGLLRGDERLHGRDHVATGEVVGRNLVGRDLDAGLDRRDAGVDHEAIGHTTKAHAEQVQHAHGSAIQLGLQPDSDEGDKDGRRDEDGDDERDDNDERD